MPLLRSPDFSSCSSEVTFNGRSHPRCAPDASRWEVFFNFIQDILQMEPAKKRRPFKQTVFWRWVIALLLRWKREGFPCYGGDILTPNLHTFVDGDECPEYILLVARLEWLLREVPFAHEVLLELLARKDLRLECGDGVPWLELRDEDERAFLRLPPDYPGTVVQCSAELG